ncbi:MAG TPA: GNAT family N-acetyltransferase [Candidatus Enterococcus stercoravium]|nr:GNAT family N-acetyltransferase [Candidatus Enterococcus stercoravium]
MLIRTAVQTLDEISDLFPIVEEIWREVFTPMIGSEQVDYMLIHYQSIPVIEKEIAAGAHYFGLRWQGELVGYTAYELKDDRILYISKLYIKQAYRGKGLMAEIFKWYDDLAQTWQRKQQLRVNQANQHAIAVYQHRGFTIVKEQRVAIGEGFVMTDYVLEK